MLSLPSDIEGLKSAKIGSLALDVYEQEGDLFFQDLSDQVIQDDVFGRLLTFPNVLVTGHQGFFITETHVPISGQGRTTCQALEIITFNARSFMALLNAS